jgi:hypothetical protein
MPETKLVFLCEACANMLAEVEKNGRFLCVSCVLEENKNDG